MNTYIRNPDQLGKVLKGERKATGLTQAAAAKQIGLYSKTVNKLENDPATSSIETLFRVLSVLGLVLTVQDNDTTSSTKDVEW